MGMDRTMSNKVIYISYYTVNTPYEKEVRKYLLPSLKKFNLPYDVQGVKDLGSWHNNTGFKSTYILQMLQKHKCPVGVLPRPDGTHEWAPAGAGRRQPRG